MSLTPPTPIDPARSTPSHGRKATMIWLAAAAVCLAGAIAMRPVPQVPVVFQDTGTLLFPKLSDPTASTSLEVQGWDDEQAQLVRFKVHMQDGRWVITSHHNYPADGVERMGRATASLVDVRKDVFKDDSPSTHGSYGVKAPDAADAQKDERGQRLILKDASGAVLADAIVGKTVPEKPGFRYVRLADSNRVYASKMALDVSTRFADWIEKDLIRIDASKVAEVESNAYSVDERSGRIRNSKPLLFVREGEGWKASDKTPAPRGKTLDSAKVQQLVDAVDQLQIVGVRPQPKHPQELALRLQQMGFFITPDGGLVGNEGQISVVLDDGLVYSLFFGEVTSLQGRALSAGVGALKEGVDNAGADKGTKPDKSDNRFMFVTVAYDPQVGADEKDPPKDDAGEGQAKAKKLAEGFQQWLYVISNASFEKIRRSPADFFKTSAAK